MESTGRRPHVCLGSKQATQKTWEKQFFTISSPASPREEEVVTDI